MVSMNLVLADDVENVESDIYLMTHTTNPLMSADTVRAALAAFREAQAAGRADSLFTVDKVQTRFYRVDCTPVNHDPDNLEIGRASCREGVCQYGVDLGGRSIIKKKKMQKSTSEKEI